MASEINPPPCLCETSGALIGSLRPTLGLGRRLTWLVFCRPRQLLIQPVSQGVAEMPKLEEQIKELIRKHLDEAAALVLVKHPAPLEKVIEIPMAKLEAIGEGLRLIARNGHEQDGINNDLGVLFDTLKTLQDQILLVARKIDEASSD